MYHADEAWKYVEWNMSEINVVEHSLYLLLGACVFKSEPYRVESEKHELELSEINKDRS